MAVLSDIRAGTLGHAMLACDALVYYMAGLIQQRYERLQFLVKFTSPCKSFNLKLRQVRVPSARTKA